MEKKQKIKQFSITTTISIFIGLIIVLLGIVLQDRYDLMGWLNAVLLAGLLLFAGFWCAFVISHGVFDVIIYSTQRLFMAIVRKKQEKSLYDYMNEDKTISKWILLAILFTSILYLLAGAILYII